ncbi:MAG: hypothetical protein RhofKO_25670 [Rhodothermales bacterium]
MPSLPDGLEADLLQVATNMWQQFHKLDLAKPLPSLTIKVVAGPRFAGEIQPIFDKFVIARFKTGCFEQLYTILEQCEEAIVGAIVHDQLEAFAPTTTVADILGGVYTVAMHFVVAHEFSHVLCGHVYRSPEDMSQEASIHAPSMAKSTPVLYYFTEMEADHTGLEIMSDAVLFGDINRVLQSSATLEPGTINSFERADRVIGYRFLLTAAWIVIRLFEHDYRRHGRDSQRYPLPAARLYGSIDTLLRDFVGFDQIKLKSGSLYATLDEHSTSEIKRFLQEVLKPVALALAEAPNQKDGHIAMISDLEGSSTEAVVADFMRDIAGLLFVQPMVTEGGQQLVDLQPLRIFVNDQLAPYRYIEGMSNA